jgi:hypothetical protein
VKNYRFFLDFVFIKFPLEKTRSQLALECGSEHSLQIYLNHETNPVILLNAK